MTAIKYYFLCAFLLSTLSSLGQRADTLTIYYPINDFQLQTEAQNQLSNAVKAPNIKSIQVLGYADYLGSVGYNLVLSANRAEVVKSFLMTKNDKLIISANGKGRIDEAVRIKTGNPKSRKVAIVVNYEVLPATPPTVIIDSIKKEKPLANPIPSPDVAKGNHIFEEKIDSLFKGEVGSSIIINELNFEGGRHLLTSRSNMYLPVLLKCLLTNSNIKIKIIGHICCVFDMKDGYDFDTKTYDLSKNRAKAIYDYLKENGVSSSRMTYKGVGSSQPKVYPEVTNDDSDLNRRVEILIVSK